MKREILFRGKALNTGKWLFGNIQIPEPPYDKYFMWDDGWQTQVDAKTIGQYTGMNIVGNIHNNPELLKGGKE